MPGISFRNNFANISKRIKMTHRFISLLAGIILFSLSLPAQVSNYSFSQSAGTWFAPSPFMTNAYTGNFDDGSQQVTINAFTFNGTSYTQMRISPNGWIMLGSAVPAANLYTPISTTQANAQFIAPFGCDLTSTNTGFSKVCWTTSNLYVSVYWVDVSRKAYGEEISFGLQLEISTGIVRFIYGPPDGGSGTAPFNPQVGLRGAANTDYNNRLVTTSNNWSNSDPGVANTSTCRYDATGPATYALQGQMYEWTPPCTPASTPTITSSANSICNGSPVTLSINTGSLNANSNWYWYSGSCGGTPVGTGTSIVVSPATNTTYYVRGEGGCVTNGSCGSKVILVNPVPTVTANASVTTVCSGSPVTLTGGGANSYSWSNGVINGSPFYPAATATYTVTGTSSGCSNTATITITVIYPPFVNANASATTICQGSPVTLTGSGAQSYSWSGGVTNGVPFYPSGTATYTVVGTASNGCTDNGTVTVTVNPAPAVSGNATATTVCQGTSITLTGSGANSYVWSGGVTNGVPFVPASSTTYTVTGTGSNGCTATAVVPITVNPLPVVTANASSASVCTGTAVTLTGGGANSYSWSGGITNGVAFIPAGTTTYTVTGTNANGCVNTATLTVTVNPVPNVTANTTASAVCQGAPVTLTGGGASSYSWSGGVTNGVAFIPAGTSTYTVTGTSSAGCVNTATVSVTVNPLPAVTANVTALTVCQGTAVTFTGGGAQSYTWSGGVTNGVPFMPAATATYTVTGTAVSGCSNTATVSVTVNPRPAVTANTTAPAVCTGIPVTLTGGGAVSYTWSGGVTNGVSFIPSSTTTYTVTGTGANGCTNTATVSVTVNPVPAVTANATATTVCQGTAVTLTGGGAQSYSWSGGVTNGISFIPAGSNTYTVTGTTSAGCSNTATVSITVNAVPAVTANVTAVTICQGTAVTFSGGGAQSYSWSGGVTNGVPFIPASTATYTVTGTAINGCTNTAAATVTVNPLPVVTANTSASAVCSGNAVTLSGGGAQSYLWSGGVVNGAGFVPVATATYTVTGTSAAGCVNTATVSVTVNQLPQVNALSTAPAVCAGLPVTLNGSGAQSYSWSGGVTNGVAFTPVATTTYTVTGTDVNGCTNTDTITVAVDPVPVVTASASAPAVCAGLPVTLSGNGALSYAWSGGVSDGLSFIPASSATYTVTGTAANGCSSTATITITVYMNPAVTANASALSVCTGDAVTLSGSGAVNYVWSGGIADNVAFVPAATASYTVTGTDSNGCSDTSAITVTVNPLPLVGFTVSDTAVCAGGSVLLSGSGAAVYSWSNGVTDNTAFFPQATASYTVTGTDNNGCTDSATATVTVYPLPAVTINLSAVDTQCTTINLVVPDSVFPAGGVFSGTGITGNTFSPAAAGPGTHVISYTYTDGNGCAATATDSIYVDVCTGSVMNSKTRPVFALYPNPAAERIFIAGPAEKITAVYIYNASGEQLHQYGRSYTANGFSLTGLAGGLYFLRIESGSTTCVLPFIH